MNWPNRITIARILLIPFFILSLMHSTRLVAAAIFTIIAASDVVDGYIARKKNQTSTAGAVLDPLADKLLVSAALIFMIGPAVRPWMVFVIIAREFIVTGLRILVPSKKIIVASFWGKLKTLTQNIAVVWILLDLPFGYYFMLVATLLTLWSGSDYLWRARKEIQL